MSTAALLTVTLTTPPWVTALLLSGRGFAVGLTIQPLLLAMISGLAPAEVPDGNTLFNVAERLGGSIGISLLITFFTLREQDRIQQVLRPLGVRLETISANNAAGAHLPPALSAQLAQAAVAGFHDTVWLLVAISALGALAALLLRGSVPEPRRGAAAISNEEALREAVTTAAVKWPQGDRGA